MVNNELKQQLEIVELRILLVRSQRQVLESQMQVLHLQEQALLAEHGPLKEQYAATQEPELPAEVATMKSTDKVIGEPDNEHTQG